MANTNIMIQKITFDTSDPQVTEVTVEIKHDDPGILLKNVYKKTFPARISVIELLQNHMFGEDSYLFW